MYVYFLILTDFWKRAFQAIFILFRFLVDEKLIERKRQDTMDMCRIFTEETKKLEKINEMKKGHRLKKKSILKHQRAKRQAKLNPAMYVDDARRVESIVDKVYDDLSEKGEKINYRRVNIQELERNNTVSL